jgi:hypothetical protein
MLFIPAQSSFAPIPICLWGGLCFGYPLSAFLWQAFQVRRRVLQTLELNPHLDEFQRTELGVIRISQQSLRYRTRFVSGVFILTAILFAFGLFAAATTSAAHFWWTVAGWGFGWLPNSAAFRKPKT